MVCTMSASRCWWGIRAGDGVNEMLGFQEIIIGPLNQQPICTGNKKAYVFILSLCCLLSVCNVFTTPRVGTQSKPLQFVLLQFIILHICYLMYIQMSLILYGGNLKQVLWQI